ncbi:MAG TPA: hypothetical protein VFT22_37565 [Kofleriaceae bacterium]|nr:hypothetical protein [Kofleriaceae bacterium]
MSRLLIPFMLLLALSAGCSDHASSIGTVELEVLGGLTGQGTGDALHVDPDGTVMRSVQGAPWQTATLPAATLHELQAKISAADFPSLEATYAGDVTDDYSDHVTVEVDGRDHEVAVDRSATPPAALTAVLDALKAIHDDDGLGWH